jgi:hypothetical protein
MPSITHSFEIIRPAVNLQPDMFSELREQYERLGSGDSMPTWVNFNIAPEYTATVFSSDELVALQQAYGLPAERQDVEELAEHLDRTLPESVDDRLRAATLPAVIYHDKNVQHFTLGAGGLIMEERQLVLDAIADFYGLSALTGKVQQTYERLTRVPMVRISAPKKRAFALKHGVMRMARVIEQSGRSVLPAEIEFSPLSIEDKLHFSE